VVKVRVTDTYNCTN